jgi:branched-chain amino acid transport system substrate-binding protein
VDTGRVATLDSSQGKMDAGHLFTTVGKVLFAFMAAGCVSSAAGADSSPVKKVEFAAALSITGDLTAFGTGSLEGIQFALEEANASGSSPQIELKVYDHASNPERAKEFARQIVASPAVLVLGPGNTVTSLAIGPVLAAAGMASITTTATSDLITENATTFRMLLKNSEEGGLMATYLSRVLGHRRAAVLIMESGYGRTLEKGFREMAAPLGIDATYHVFKEGENFEEAVAAIAPQIADRPVVLAMLDVDGARVLTALRRLGNKGPFLGGDAFGIETFNSRFAGLPEEKEHKGYFCDGLYGITPMLLDSANAELLSFAERFRDRFGHNPGWMAVAGYDSARLAIETVRNMEANASSDAPAMRAAALKYLLTLNDPLRAPAGLLGPLAFDSARGRQTAVRVGRFVQGHFESAPVQIVPAPTPHENEIKSGAVFETHPGQYSRLQQVIYSGVYLNEIMWMDQARFTFAADFYIWLRFAKNSGVDAADPGEIKFPDLSSGRFDREHPLEEREMADGTIYRLWRVQGDFRNPFDLHRYPFDRQTLTIRFFNARAAADHIVYALDQSASDLGETHGSTTPSGAAAEAFRALSQWRFLQAHQRRENFVAKSSLGDPLRLGRVNFRELSGYAASFDLQRRALSVLIKNLLPLWLMTCMLYASLHFPPILVQPKIGVGVTAMLTGMVLLNSVNNQMGAIGYTAAVEYAFYLFFALGLLHIVSVLLTERLRDHKRAATAHKVDFWTRAIFLGAVLGIFLVGFFQLRSP